MLGNRFITCKELASPTFLSNKITQEVPPGEGPSWLGQGGLPSWAGTWPHPSTPVLIFGQWTRALCWQEKRRCSRLHSGPNIILTTLWAESATLDHTQLADKNLPACLSATRPPSIKGCEQSTDTNSEKAVIDGKQLLRVPSTNCLHPVWKKEGVVPVMRVICT